MMEGTVPSLGLQVVWNPRRGRIVQTPAINNDAPAGIKLAKEHSFVHKTAKMWNLLPKCIRNTTNVSVDTFKFQLDRHLRTVIDQPRVLSLTSQCSTTSNCLASILPVAEAERIRSGAVMVSTVHSEGGAPLTSLH